MPDEDMKLPEGKTCKDCAHYPKFCSWYLGASKIEDNTYCDWAPSRYYEAPKKEEVKNE